MRAKFTLDSFVILNYTEKVNFKVIQKYMKKILTMENIMDIKINGNWNNGLIKGYGSKSFAVVNY